MIHTTAHHEAVACVVLGIEIVDFWIDCDGGRVNHRYPVHNIVGGRDVTEDNYDANVENAYLESIVITLAGEAAYAECVQPLVTKPAAKRTMTASVVPISST
jgi:hypothetical protein